MMTRTSADSVAMYERRCRLLLRLAYPPRFREFRGEELLGTLLDLAEPGRTRPSLPTALDVVRGGLVLRLRERPPVWHWLLYRIFRKRLPYAYRWWARDDIRGRFFAGRYILWTMALFYVPGVLLGDDHGWRTRLVIWSLFWAHSLIRRRIIALRLLAKHEFQVDGAPYAPVSHVPAADQG